MAVGRVVVLRALGLGDLLTAVPALRALAAHFPAHRRVLAAPAALGTLVARPGLVDEVVDCDLRAGGGPAPLRPLPAELRGAAVAVNLHGRGPQSTTLLAGTGPERLIAFAEPGAPARADRPAWLPHEHEVMRWCRLLRRSGIACDPDRLDLPVATDPTVAGATILHPGAASPARRWPPDRWAAVARAELNDGHRVLVTGDASEVSLAESVAARAGLPAEDVLAGRTDVEELAAIVAGAGRVVCADTGVAHLATATSTPSVVLFGPTSPQRWGPPESRGRHRALWRGASGDAHGQRVHPELLAIGVDDVLAALRGLPRRGAPVPIRPSS